MTDSGRDTRFLQCLNERILVLDGAMGTSLHDIDLPLSDYRDCENCPEILNETRPDVIADIHRSFFEVGCDAVETNTFGGTPLTLSEFGLQDKAEALNRRAAEIARGVADEFSTPERPRFVLGSMGPGTRLITLRQVSYEDLLAAYTLQARALIAGGADALIIETCQDILQAKTVVQAARAAFEDAGRKLPLIVQVTMETTGTMLVGTDIAAALTVLEAYPEVDVIGLNCATGPREMSEHIRYLAHHCSRRLSVVPNAGLPQVVDGRAHFPLQPAELARWLREFVIEDGVNLVGGCCGTRPSHLKAVVEAVADLKPTPRTATREPSTASIYQSTPHRQDNSFLIIGERCNTNGSRKFKRLLAEGDIDGLVQTAEEQVRQDGAHVLDVCVDYVGRDGVPDMERVIDRFATAVTVPLMLDSTEPPVLEAGLKLLGGKSIINSVNLEDGEEKLARIAGLARQHGACLVALTIDEDPQEAMGKTADRKLQIATRLHTLLVDKYGIPEEDIFFDCLTFPITTGNEADRRLGLETLDGIERIMQRFPRCQSVLGLSNISFGLDPAARVVLNSVYLHEARERGLTAAIVHASKILPRNQISDERWNAALDLIYDRHNDGNPLERFIGLFSEGETIGTVTPIDDLPIEERLKRRIIDGQRKGIEADLDEARQTYSPLDIINTFLLDGMKVVGELFGSGQMQLPFVLKSAETMKSAVAHLEPHMERVEGETRGRMLLATVRGDVHDIGKNLVDIIVSNNGFEVVNLGIKQPINAIIEAMKKHNPNVIGLSGLLVKSTIVMRDDLAVLNEQKIDIPVVLGGAALTRRYVEEDLRAIYNGPLYYAKDAFEGLDLMRKVCDPESQVEAAPAATAEDEAPAPVTSEREARQSNLAKLAEEVEQRYGLREVEGEAATAAATLSRSDLGHEHPVPQPPFWGPRLIEQIDLRAALGYVNETMLFQVQWGFRKKGRRPDAWQAYLAREVRPHYRELVSRCIAEEILQPKAIYGYWPAQSDGDELVIYAPPADPGAGPDQHGDEILRYRFPRQKQEPYWCLSDFWRPVEGGVTDVVAFQIVTAGQRVSEVARQWFEANEYQQYLFLHGLGVETAEALAEYMHKQVRSDLGVGGSDARDLQKLFKQGYQGSRYSFGYPACPNLEDQVPLMKLLEPERLGITLSEEFQLEPEQSTSAIITYHPDARYFNVR